MTFERLLKTAIKLAAVALTAPATWEVAGQLYDGPVQSLVVQVAALVLVEGALLLGWHGLDHAEDKTAAERLLYASIAGVAYVVLFGVALEHGEGLAGVSFRATLGVLLLYSMIQAGVLAGVRLRRASEGNIYEHRKVKRFYLREAIEDAQGTIRLNFLENRLDRDKQRRVIAARFALREQAIEALASQLEAGESQVTARCEGCGRAFEGSNIQQAEARRNGHKAHCKGQAKGQAADSVNGRTSARTAAR